ncbi:response regulator [Rhodovibrio salinarum]|nr:response regulator [Rhodovibrio salinarum]
MVLIIDDNPHIRGHLRAALELEGMQVCEQDPCDRPTSEVLEPVYTVVLLDVVMPEKDGFEYLRDIRRMWPNQRLIVYSHGLDEYPQYAVKLGADAGFDISQPAKLRQLVETARRMACEAQKSE